MSNLAMKLDTLSYAKKLIAAGCEPKLAEAHASLQQDVLVEVSEDYLSQFATKQDLDAHRIATKHDIEELRIGTKHDIEELRIATKHDLAMLEQRIETKIAKATTKTIRTLGGIVVGTALVLVGAVGILIQLHI